MHGTVEFWWLWDHHNLSLFPLIHLINIVRWSTYPIKPWNKQPPFPYQFCRFRVPKHKIRANHSRGKIEQSNHSAPTTQKYPKSNSQGVNSEGVPRESQWPPGIRPRWKSYIKYLDGQLSFPGPSVSTLKSFWISEEKGFFFFSFFWIFFLSYPSSSFVFSRDSSSYLLRIVGKRSVVGLNFDFVVLNLTKHSSYLIYNAVLYFSPAVQRQYREKYGIGQVCVFGFSFLHFLLIKKFLHYVSFLWS